MTRLSQNYGDISLFVPTPLVVFIASFIYKRLARYVTKCLQFINVGIFLRALRETFYSINCFCSAAFLCMSSMPKMTKRSDVTQPLRLKY